ncbi:DUF5316 family protein [Methanosarcina sp. 2.H.A.1B.4]|uniref:DUF5316 family protein n=1 Tax=Methanosarcina sp. 2.H.A.1B.4 TaxID=1483600 RepID=UPI00350F0844
MIGFAGLIFVATAGVLTGSVVNGDRVRANYDTEDEERKEKNRLSKNLFLLALSISPYQYLLMNSHYSDLPS